MGGAGTPGRTLHHDVGPGIHRIEDADTNWYLVDDGTALTVVDAGVPTSWASLHDALRRLGRAASDIRALVLTHAHFDHVGFAERARTELGVPVHVHVNDVPLTRHPMQYAHERARLPYFLTQVKAFPIVFALLRNRAFFPPAIGAVEPYADGTLPVPGEPEVLFTPGHTLGHCALLLRDRGVLLAGDAVVMLDPYTAETAPKIVAGAATADSARNLQAPRRHRGLRRADHPHRPRRALVTQRAIGWGPLPAAGAGGARARGRGSHHEASPPRSVTSSTPCARARASPEPTDAEPRDRPLRRSPAGARRCLRPWCRARACRACGPARRARGRGRPRRAAAPR